MASRWAAFTPSELDELGIALDHRLDEAINGNAYAYWHVVGPLLLDLYEYDGDLTGMQHTAQRMAELEAEED